MGTNPNTDNGFHNEMTNPVPLLNIKQEPNLRGDVNEHLKRMESVLGGGEMLSNELEFMEGNLHLGKALSQTN